jgi:hypothetical protein
MTWHTQNAFGWKHHGHRTEFIPADVAAAAGIISLGHLHLVNRPDPVWLRQPLPEDRCPGDVFDGLYILEMTGAAADGTMKVMGDFLMMRLVALAAVA